MTREDVRRVADGEVKDSRGQALRLGDQIVMPRGHSIVVGRVTGWARDGLVWVDYTNLSGKLVRAKRAASDLTIASQPTLFDAGGAR